MSTIETTLAALTDLIDRQGNVQGKAILQLKDQLDIILSQNCKQLSLRVPLHNMRKWLVDVYTELETQCVLVFPASEGAPLLTEDCDMQDYLTELPSIADNTYCHDPKLQAAVSQYKSEPLDRMFPSGKQYAESLMMELLLLD